MEFTPEETIGTVELTYTLDASTLAGTTIVVFETLYQDGVEIAAHANINDTAQTITINPKGGLLIRKTSEDGVLEGFTFLVEGNGYSETFTTDGAGEIYIQDLGPRRVHRDRTGERSHRPLRDPLWPDSYCFH